MKIILNNTAKVFGFKKMTEKREGIKEEREWTKSQFSIIDPASAIPPYDRLKVSVPIVCPFCREIEGSLLISSQAARVRYEWDCGHVIIAEYEKPDMDNPTLDLFKGKEQNEEIENTEESVND